MDKKVSCIIPAYNEEKRIGRVVSVCLETKLINEIIVVNDGSSDRTLGSLEKFKNKISIINLLKNRGKGFAVSQGVEKARGEVILLLDADLTDLQVHHLYSLIAPVLDQDVDMTIGAFVSFDKPYYYNWPFSGQRAIKRELLASLLGKISRTKYAIEVVLNEELRKKKVVVVPLIDLSFVKKTGKQKDWLNGYLKMNFEVAQSIVKYKSKRLKQKMFNEAVRKYFK